MQFQTINGIKVGRLLIPVKPHQASIVYGCLTVRPDSALGKQWVSQLSLILTGHHYFQHLLTVESAGPYTKPFLHSWVI